MTSSSDQNMFFREVIMDHYTNPRNKGLVGDPSYKTVHLKNPSCGDDISVQLKLDEKDDVADCRYMGSGCAICCSSGSMMTELLKDKTSEEALEIIRQFKQMVSGEPYDEELLEECISLQGVTKVPPRINCATLAWNAAEAGIKQLMEGHNADDETIII